MALDDRELDLLARYEQLVFPVLDDRAGEVAVAGYRWDLQAELRGLLADEGLLVVEEADADDAPGRADDAHLGDAVRAVGEPAPGLADGVLVGELSLHPRHLQRRDGHRLEQQVADGVAKAVVDVFEAVQVEE